MLIFSRHALGETALEATCGSFGTVRAVSIEFKGVAEANMVWSQKQQQPADSVTQLGAGGTRDMFRG